MMKGFFLGFFALLFLISCTQEKVTTVRIGLQPNEATRDLESLKEEAEGALKSSVELKVSKDYSDLVTMLQKGSVDFAVLSPLNFVDAESKVNLKVLFKKIYGDSEFYYSAIVARKDSGFGKLEDIKGKRLAFVDKKSTSGYLYPLVMLQQASLAEADVKASFSGTHVDAVEALVSKQVDAAAVWANPPEQGGGAWTGVEFEQRELPQMMVLSYSEPIPNDAIVVRSAFYERNPKVVLRFMDALIAMSESKSQVLKKVFGVDKLATATSRHYDSVRRIRQLKEK